MCRGRPVLPEDLASEIQQFVQAEFARQYFTTHRTGFIFRKKVPVEKMMTWQKVYLFCISCQLLLTCVRS